MYTRNEYVCNYCRQGKIRPIQFSLKQAVVHCDNIECESYLHKRPWECIITRPLSESNLCRYERDSICSSDSSGVHSDLGSSGVSHSSITDKEVEFLLRRKTSHLVSLTDHLDFESSNDQSSVWPSKLIPTNQEPFVVLDSHISASNQMSGAKTNFRVETSVKVTGNERENVKVNNTFEKHDFLDMLKDFDGVSTENSISANNVPECKDAFSNELESWLDSFHQPPFPGGKDQTSSISMDKDGETQHCSNPSNTFIPSVRSAFYEVSPSKINVKEGQNNLATEKDSKASFPNFLSSDSNFLSPASSGFSEESSTGEEVPHFTKPFSLNVPISVPLLADSKENKVGGLFSPTDKHNGTFLTQSSNQPPCEPPSVNDSLMLPTLIDIDDSPLDFFSETQNLEAINHHKDSSSDALLQNKSRQGGHAPNDRPNTRSSNNSLLDTVCKSEVSDRPIVYDKENGDSDNEIQVTLDMLRLLEKCSTTGTSVENKGKSTNLGIAPTQNTSKSLNSDISNSTLNGVVNNSKKSNGNILKEDQIDDLLKSNRNDNVENTNYITSSSLPYSQSVSDKSDMSMLSAPVNNLEEMNSQLGNDSDHSNVCMFYSPVINLEETHSSITKQDHSKYQNTSNTKLHNVESSCSSSKNNEEPLKENTVVDSMASLSTSDTLQNVKKQDIPIEIDPWPTPSNPNAKNKSRKNEKYCNNKILNKNKYKRSSSLAHRSRTTSKNKSPLTDESSSQSMKVSPVAKELVRETSPEFSQHSDSNSTIPIVMKDDSLTLDSHTVQPTQLITELQSQENECMSRVKTVFKGIEVDPWSIQEVYVDELNIEVVLKKKEKEGSTEVPRKKEKEGNIEALKKKDKEGNIEALKMKEKEGNIEAPRTKEKEGNTEALKKREKERNIEAQRKKKKEGNTDDKTSEKDETATVKGNKAQSQKTEDDNGRKDLVSESSTSLAQNYHSEGDTAWKGKRREGSLVDAVTKKVDMIKMETKKISDTEERKKVLPSSCQASSGIQSKCSEVSATKEGRSLTTDVHSVKQYTTRTDRKRKTSSPPKLDLYQPFTLRPEVMETVYFRESSLPHYCRQSQSEMRESVGYNFKPTTQTDVLQRDNNKESLKMKRSSSYFDSLLANVEFDDDFCIHTNNKEAESNLENSLSEALFAAEPDADDSLDKSQGSEKEEDCLPLMQQEEGEETKGSKPSKKTSKSKGIASSKEEESDSEMPIITINSEDELDIFIPSKKRNNDEGNSETNKINNESLSHSWEKCHHPSKKSEIRKIRNTESLSQSGDQCHCPSKKSEIKKINIEDLSHSQEKCHHPSNESKIVRESDNNENSKCCLKNDVNETQTSSELIQKNTSPCSSKREAEMPSDFQCKGNLSEPHMKKQLIERKDMLKCCSKKKHETQMSPCKCKGKDTPNSSINKCMKEDQMPGKCTCEGNDKSDLHNKMNSKSEGFHMPECSLKKSKNNGCPQVCDLPCCGIFENGTLHHKSCLILSKNRSLQSNLSLINAEDHISLKTQKELFKTDCFTLSKHHDKFGNLKMQPEFFDDSSNALNDNLNLYSVLFDDVRDDDNVEISPNSLNSVSQEIGSVEIRKWLSSDEDKGIKRKNEEEPDRSAKILKTSEGHSAFYNEMDFTNDGEIFFNSNPEHETNQSHVQDSGKDDVMRMLAHSYSGEDADMNNQQRVTVIIQNNQKGLSGPPYYNIPKKEEKTRHRKITDVLRPDSSVSEVVQLLKDSGWVITPCDPVINYKMPPHATSPTIVPAPLEKEYGETGADVVMWSLTDKQVPVCLDGPPADHSLPPPSVQNLSNTSRVEVKTKTDLAHGKSRTKSSRGCENLEDLQRKEIERRKWEEGFNRLYEERQGNHVFNSLTPTPHPVKRSYISMSNERRSISKRIENNWLPTPSSSASNVQRNQSVSFKTLRMADGSTYVCPAIVKKGAQSLVDENGKGEVEPPLSVKEEPPEGDGDSSSDDCIELPNDLDAYQEALKDGHQVLAPPALPSSLYIPPPSPTKIKPKKQRVESPSSSPVAEEPEEPVEELKDKATEEPVEVLKDRATEELTSIVSQRPSKEIPDLVCMTIGGQLYFYHRKDT